MKTNTAKFHLMQPIQCGLCGCPLYPEGFDKLIHKPYLATTKMLKCKHAGKKFRKPTIELEEIP